MSSDNNEELQLSDVILQVNNHERIQKSTNNQRQPKRILHFSDGDLVEYSDDETDNIPMSHQNQHLVDPRALDWVSWTLHQTSWVGSKVLEGCDYVGEVLADFLGITSPKYQFEINEYNRLQKLQAEERERELKEMENWSSSNNGHALIVTDVKNNEQN